MQLCLKYTVLTLSEVGCCGSCFDEHSVKDSHNVCQQLHSQLSEKQAEIGREKKQREQLESHCHKVERDLESVKRSGSRPSQNAETAKEVAKYVYTVEVIFSETNTVIQQKMVDFM